MMQAHSLHRQDQDPTTLSLTFSMLKSIVPPQVVLLLDMWNLHFSSSSQSQVLLRIHPLHIANSHFTSALQVIEFH